MIAIRYHQQQPRTQGLLCTRLGKEGPGKRWSRVRQILQESWSISPRAGFVEIMTGGEGKVRERTMAI